MVGHHRRYTKTLLRDHLTQGGLDICVMRYWGITLTPIALVRKLYVDRIRDTGKVAKAGFEPPSPVFGGIFSALQTFENNVLPRPPIGTSVLAIARKPPSQAAAH